MSTDGTFEIRTIRPALYQIPIDGSCKLIAAAGWRAWRPAHLRVKISAPGREELTAQLYFPGGAHNDDDIASAVKPRTRAHPVAERRRLRDRGLLLRPGPGARLMLFHVRMDVCLPHDLDPPIRAEIVEREKAYSQKLQQEGRWPHIWRIVGEYANYSIFDVDSTDQLHELLSGLPLFPYMNIKSHTTGEAPVRHSCVKPRSRSAGW